MPITEEYVKSLPPIYTDILAAFPEFNPTRNAGYGLAFQSLYSALNGKYNLGQIKVACEQMANGGVMEIKNEIFAHPTSLGEELIAAITGHTLSSIPVPPFTPPNL